MAQNAPGWDLWRAFDAAMEERTLSGAARRLGVTQPTLGRQIEALEESLGFSLFVRSQKGLSPTEAALGVAPLARNMAATAEAILRTAKGGQEQDAGSVRLSAPEIVSHKILPGMIADFCAEYPRIDVELRVSNAVDNILAREADIAVRMVEPSQQALVSRKIGDVEIGLYAHRSYIERNGMPLSIDDAPDHRLIGYDTLGYPMEHARQLGFDMIRSDFSLRTDNDIVQNELIMAGAGIGGMAKSFAEGHPDLVPVMHNQFCLTLGMWLVMHEDMRDAGPTRLLFDFLVRRLGEYINETA